MAFKCIAFLLSCFLLKYCIYGEKAKGKYLHPFSGEAYKTLLLLVQGTFNMPVAESTREQKNAVMRYWRNRDRFHLGPQVTLTLYFDDKKVVKKSTISGLVSKLFDDAKSGGWKKLRNRAAAGFVGLREKQQTVTAKSVHLMDLSKDAVEHDRRVYRYVLSVMDVFSRYYWLRPLEKRASHHISQALKAIYTKHGPPDHLQGDRGSEFEGKVRPLCKALKIKLIKSRPYHPQSQGKVERLHRQLRKKIMYHLVTLGRRELIGQQISMTTIGF